MHWHMTLGAKYAIQFYQQNCSQLYKHTQLKFMPNLYALLSIPSTRKISLNLLVQKVIKWWWYCHQSLHIFYINWNQLCIECKVIKSLLGLIENQNLKVKNKFLKWHSKWRNGIADSGSIRNPLTLKFNLSNKNVF